MKHTTRRMLSLLLALVLALSIIPMTGMAMELIELPLDPAKYTKYTLKDGSFFVVDNSTGLIINSTNPSYPISELHLHDHAIGYMVNRDGHFYGCECGVRGIVTPHMDPADAIDGKCYCGYSYYTNADLTVLWLAGMNLSPRFNKETTEYVGKLYHDGIDETKISAFTMDARATVELPEDLTIKEGKNVFEITVTAEDGKTTKTYTVTVEK